MLDQQGRVVEGTMSNLLLLQAGNYITPRIDDCGIAGVVRQLVLDCAKIQAQRVQVGYVSLQALQQADAVFILNSLLGVRQVLAFDDHLYPRLPMPTFLQHIQQICFTPEKANFARC
jgi:4-amino-4-deoxychorismate lyase